MPDILPADSESFDANLGTSILIWFPRPAQNTPTRTAGLQKTWQHGDGSYSTTKGRMDSTKAVEIALVTDRGRLWRIDNMSQHRLLYKYLA